VDTTFDGIHVVTHFSDTWYAVERTAMSACIVEVTKTVNTLWFLDMSDAELPTMQRIGLMA